MIDKKLEDIELSDIQRLRDDARPEDRQLEYKSQLPTNKSEEKKKFLAEVSSLANASGGDLVIGVSCSSDGENKGLPFELKPIMGDSPDDAKLRLENMIRDGIQPRLRLSIKPITSDNGFYIVIRVPQSFESPHMINGSKPFYSRNSAGKYPLDVNEIRQAFLASDSWEQKIRNWRNDRLAKIVAGETPVPLDTDDRLILHIIPIRNFLRKVETNLLENRGLSLFPMGSSGTNPRINFDGWLFPGGAQQYGFHSYTQLFRYGMIEAVGTMFRKDKKDENQKIKRVVYPLQIERWIMDALRGFYQSRLNTDSFYPLMVTLSILGVKDTYAPVDSFQTLSAHVCERDVLVLPDFFIEDIPESFDSFLKPPFNALWNAYGFAGSPSFNENDEWKPKV